MIQVENLTKSYANLLAIDKISFRIGEGEMVGFLGPNGAGKSTTIKAMTGILAPTQGRVLIDGIDMYVDPIKAKQNIGYLPERPPLYHDMKVREYLIYVAKLKRLSSAKIKEAIPFNLARMGLTDVASRLIGHLSKGYQQRVGLAQALVGDPKVLILDEPTVGLDPKQRLEMKQLLKGLAGKHTIFMSSHLLSEVEDLCERILIIRKGLIIEDNLLVNLKTESSRKNLVVLQIQSEITTDIKQAFKLLAGVKSVRLATLNSLIIEIESSAINLDSLAKYVMDNNWGLLGIKNQEVGLEDVFLEAVAAGESDSEGRDLI